MFRQLIKVCNFSTYRQRFQQQVMVKVLNVAEKNDAAKNIAEHLSRGRFRRKEGLSKYNKIYEFEYNLMGQPSTMMMTSVSGHLLEVEFVGGYRKWESCNPVSLFDAPLNTLCIPQNEPIKKTLEREIRGCNTLIIWTDCDREGENIGFQVIQVCKNVRQNLKIYRAVFSEITYQAVTRALSNLGNPDKRISDAVDVRRELDLRIGAAFTRFQTMRFRRVFPRALADALISYGSCQFPTLGFVVERYKQIKDFISEIFWKLRALHKVDKDEVIFTWNRGRLFDKTACLCFYDICTENPKATVVNVTSKPKSKWRPLPLDTVELEKLASRKLRINAKETMKIAEKLYTAGFISYPRTETNIFPDGLDLRPLVEMQVSDQQWGEFAARVLQDGPNPRKGKKSDQAHPPIHPTKYTNNLQGNESKVYEFIVRHFLACVSKDAEGYETVVEIDIAKERFHATGLMITARNYLEVYPYDKWADKNIPVYNLGDVFTPKIEMNESETTPPPLLTEADLIALMEKHNIGTDATHAEHIEKIKSRLYIGVQGDGRFTPGQLGLGLVEGYDAMGFEMSKPYLRAELEADLKRICEGVKDPKVVLREQIAKYKEVFVQTMQQVNKLDQSLAHYLEEQAEEYQPPEVQEEVFQSIMKCSKCNSDMVLKKRQDGEKFYIGCMAFPGCRNALWLPAGVIDVKITNCDCELCLPRKVRKLEFTFKPGSMPVIYSTKYTSCIGGCDQSLLEDLGLPTQGLTDANDSGYGRSRSSFDDSGSFGDAVSSFQPPRSGAQSVRTSTRPANSYENSFTTWSSSQSSSAQPRQQQRTPLGIANLDDNNNSNGNDDTRNTVKCLCNTPAVLLTVKKEGPNTGRKFYSCDKRRNETPCNFFLWAAADGSPEERNFEYDRTNQDFSSSVRGQAARKSQFQSSDSKKRKCGICRETGHNKKNCPSAK